MFVRIVKMSFHEEKIPEFFEHFHTVKHLIRNFPGNNFLEVYQDKNNPSIIFTYSVWNHESDLENYRNSELFKSVWKFTKQFFKDKPEAWSVDKLVSLP
ncbi:antibiotic biosynthesis monooxygenase [Myroides sp. JBRI-B21084]|uniref:putative quinol monooxygenase n=1 Tax=Myroides sp. JBRI-B21084 TaxID=3119977 RepID=UPI0026E2CB5E|nr:antibiotic biosynthesis monooxygenase family protein [Paenimyroides cloacae]WKW47598.1 antibiotic biosynthesis monooxygenase [Paenimyroides cloacae]